MLRTLLLLALVLPMLGVPLPRDTTLVLRFAPPPGERLTLDVQRTIEEHGEEAGRRLLLERTQHAWTVEAEVRGRRPAGYALAWTWRPAHGEGAPSPRFEPRTATLEHVTVVFAADSLGRPEFVLNPRWVRTRLEQAIAAQAPVTDARDRPRLEAARRQAATPEGLRALLLADAERLALPLGRTYAPGRPVRIRSALDNPFGPGTIPAEATLRLDSLRDGRAYVSWRLEPDPRALAEVVLDLLEGFAPGAVRLTPQEVARRFEVVEEARFVVDARHGRVLHAAFERRTRSGARTRLERSSFALRPPT